MPRVVAALLVLGILLSPSAAGALWPDGSQTAARPATADAREGANPKPASWPAPARDPDEALRRVGHRLDLDGNGMEDVLDVLVRGAAPGERLAVIALLAPEASESKLAAALARAGADALRVFSIVPAIAMELPVDAVPAVASFPEVAGLYHDARVRALSDATNAALRVQEARAAFPADGRGVGIAILDTGLDASHESLAVLPHGGPKVVGWHDVVGGRPEPYDDDGHGTHVASIAAGVPVGTRYGGVAPGAHLVGVKVLDASGAGTESGVIAGMEWTVANAAALGVRVLSMSLGANANGDGTSPIERAATAAARAGLVTVVSAGNAGPGERTVRIPAAAYDVIAVGAVDNAKNLAPFSSRGTTLDGRIKPEVSAPGVGVVAAAANTGDEYVSLSGTSMAAPHVAGVAALLLERSQGTLAPAAVREILWHTAEDAGEPGPDAAFGAGVVDALEAARASEPRERFLWLSDLKAPSWAAPEQEIEVTLSLSNLGTRDASDAVARLRVGGEEVAASLESISAGATTELRLRFRAPAQTGAKTIVAEIDDAPGDEPAWAKRRTATLRVVVAEGVVKNGGFETGDLWGWSIARGGFGNWYAQDGTRSPRSDLGLAPPPGGDFAATTDQQWRSSNVLYQDVAIPREGSPKLSFLVYYRNRAGEFHAPDTLSEMHFPNQQYRVDLLTPWADPTSVLPVDIVANLFQTKPGDPPRLAPLRICHDLSLWAGHALRLRIAQVNNQGHFHASVDDVRLENHCPPAPPAASPPDLLVSALALDPPNPEQGRRPALVATVENVGLGPAAQTFLSFRIGNERVLVRTPPVEPGRSLAVSASGPALAAGSYVLTATADASADLDESDATNNQRTHAFAVVAAPPPGGCPPPPAEGFVECFDDGSGLPDGWSATGLWHVSSCQTASAPASLAYHRGACPDDYDAGLTQGSARLPPLRVKGAPVVLRFDSRSATECDGECMYDRRQVLASVNGDSFRPVFEENDGPWSLRTVPLDGLAPGDLLRLRFAFDSVDHLLNDHEGWSVDNVQVTHVERAPPSVLPDLVVSEMRIEGLATSPRDRLLRAVVENRGALPSEPSHARLRIEGPHAAEAVAWTPALAPGASATVEAAFRLAPGDHVVQAWADAFDDVDESDEANAAAPTPFQVPAVADLVLASWTAEPSKPRDGDSVDLTLVVRNDGTAAAPPSTLRVDVDDGSAYETPLPRLAPEESATVRVPWTAAAGTRTLTAVVDARDDVDEWSEGNNGGELSVRVLPGRQTLLAWAFDHRTIGTAVEARSLELAADHEAVEVALSCPRAASSLALASPDGMHRIVATCALGRSGATALLVPAGTYRLVLTSAGVGDVSVTVTGLPAA